QPNQCHDAALLLCRVGRLLRLRRIHHREHAMTGIVAPAEVVEFWRQAGAEKWFRGGPEFDALCRERLLPTHMAASRAELAEWERDATGSLALVLLPAHLTRNLFRGSAHAYATDPMARAVAERANEHGHDMHTHARLRFFYYLTFTHS